jgi:hypothetical protein
VEVDSATEPGYLDVVVVISDRKLRPRRPSDAAGLEAMSRRDGLVAVRVVLDPDAKVTSAEPLHPAFTTFVSSALWVRYEPTAYDEARRGASTRPTAERIPPAVELRRHVFRADRARPRRDGAADSLAVAREPGELRRRAPGLRGARPAAVGRQQSTISAGAGRESPALVVPTPRGPRSGSSARCRARADGGENARSDGRARVPSRRRAVRQARRIFPTGATVATK